MNLPHLIQQKHSASGVSLPIIHNNERDFTFRAEKMWLLSDDNDAIFPIDFFIVAPDEPAADDENTLH